VVAALCELLDWDTQFWGFRVGSIRDSKLTPEVLDRIDAWCRSERVRCLYFLAEASDIASTTLAESSGFRLVDVRMTYARQPASAAVEGIREAHVQDVAAMRSIALTSYRDTRFYIDPHFPPQQTDQLYATWIEKSCSGWADAVLVADTGLGVDGYVTCSLQHGGTGSIGLLGVREAARGRGIANRLIVAALAWFAAHGATEVKVVTQVRNRAAQRTYARAGFLIDDVGLWFHRWHDDEGVHT
jgi:RimJ/RimL family protein N-acetyltransferase